MTHVPKKLLSMMLELNVLHVQSLQIVQHVSTQMLLTALAVWMTLLFYLKLTTNATQVAPMELIKMAQNAKLAQALPIAKHANLVIPHNVLHVPPPSLPIKKMMKPAKQSARMAVFCFQILLIMTLINIAPHAHRARTAKPVTKMTSQNARLVLLHIHC